MNNDKYVKQHQCHRPRQPLYWKIRGRSTTVFSVLILTTMFFSAFLPLTSVSAMNIGTTAAVGPSHVSKDDMSLDDLSLSSDTDVPVAEADGPYNGVVNVPITVDGSHSYMTSGLPGDYQNDEDTVSIDVSSNDGSTSDPSSIGLSYQIQPIIEKQKSVSISSTTVSSDDSSASIDSISVDSSDTTDSSSVSTGSEDAIVGYRWDFTNDGIYETGWLTIPTTTHTYDAVGKYTVKLQVNGNDKTAVDTAQVTIYPQKVTGLSVIASADGTKLSLSWTPTIPNAEYYEIYRNDEYINSPGVNSYLDGPVSVGTYSYAVCAVEKNDGDIFKGEKSDPVSGRLPSTNTPPVAKILTSDKLFVWAGKPTTLSGIDSYDTDGEIVSYNWNFGDGKTGSGSVVKHTYSKIGYYTITLTVTDDHGLTGTDTAKIPVVDSTPPTADAGGPYIGDINQSIMFNGSRSYNPDGTSLTYTWNFGDGTKGTGKLVNHSYSVPANYTVTITVSDAGGSTDTNTTYAIINNTKRTPSKPEIHATAPADNPYEYSLTAVSLADDIDDMIHYVINWDDGTPITTTPSFSSMITVIAEHIWSSAGTYVISVYAEDQIGAKSEVNQTTITIKDPDQSLATGYHGDTGGQASVTQEIQIPLFYVVLTALIVGIGVGIAIPLLYRKLRARRIYSFPEIDTEETNLSSENP
ncbi:MAG: PKD domain-containing protein [Euryarchaeota archaeon]|nr:PKD domain-containing protein [Euryarchaeota archaeon]